MNGYIDTKHASAISVSAKTTCRPMSRKKLHAVKRMSGKLNIERLTPLPKSDDFLTWTRVAMGDILKTGFHSFSSPRQINGLGKVAADGAFEILAVYSLVPGRGHFRAFLHECRVRFPRVRILGVWNPWLGVVLTRYGFREYIRTEPNGEIVPVFEG